MAHEVDASEKLSSATRPWIKLDFVIRNEKLADGNYNDYVKSFCRNKGLIDRLYAAIKTDPAISKLLNKQYLKKELTECYSAICLVERSLRRRGAACKEGKVIESLSFCQPCDEEAVKFASNPLDLVDNESTDEPLLTFSAIRENSRNLVFYDICSGKGVLSFLLAVLFPEVPRIVMVDSNANMKLDHLDSECCTNVFYINHDIYSESFLSFMNAESTECRLLGHIPIVIGLHLCGTLSTRLTQLFNSNDLLPILILSPCCAPTRSKKNRAFMTRERLRQNKWCSYAFWYMSVYVSLTPVHCVKDIIKDELVLSEKNTLILAIKRNFLSALAVDDSSSTLTG